jgi:hypothetical protein
MDSSRPAQEVVSMQSAFVVQWFLDIPELSGTISQDELGQKVVKEPELPGELKARLEAAKLCYEEAKAALIQVPVEDFDELRKRIIGLVGADSGPNSLAEKTEVEFDADYSLKYANVVKAITAVSGQYCK